MDDLDTLSVYANPYTYIDHKGHLAGVVAFDPEHSGGARRWVGAVLEKDKCKVAPRGKGDIRSPATDVVFTFSNAPQRVLATQYYIDQIRDGSLVPADEASAERAGVAFVSPRKALAYARDAAIAGWRTHYGATATPSFAKGEAFLPASVAPAAPAAEGEDAALDTHPHDAADAADGDVK